MNQIYKITNQANGKVYVGLTTQGIDRRWSEHKSRFKLGKRDHKLYLAMKKWGIEKFKLEVIHEVDDPSELSELEREYIRKYDSLNRGYNMTDGGETVSDETKEKLRKIMTGRKITWTHKVVATRRASGVWAHGEQRGPDNPNSKHYLVKHPDGKEEVIHGLRAFCRVHSLDHKTLLDVLKGKQAHHKGYVLLTRFNDYDESQYIQADGSGAYAVTRTA